MPDPHHPERLSKDHLSSGPYCLDLTDADKIVIFRRIVHLPLRQVLATAAFRVDQLPAAVACYVIPATELEPDDEREIG